MACRPRPWIAAALLAAAFATPAQAQNLRASEPQGFIDFFQTSGYPAQLGEDGIGDPYIEFRYNGVVLPLWFYDCVANKNCQSVQFYYAYGNGAPFPLEKLNEWNGEARRYTRAYQIEGDILRLEMDVYTGADGISPRDFETLLKLWFERLEDFERFIDW